MFVLSDGLDLNVYAREKNQPIKKKPQERKTASHQERKSNWLAVFLSCGFFFIGWFSRARKTPSQLHDITRIRSVLPWYLVLQ